MWIYRYGGVEVGDDEGDNEPIEWEELGA